MTLNGAIMELVMLSEHPIMPVIFKPSIQKIIETVSECEEPDRKTGKWINGKCNRCGEHAPFWAMASTYHCSNFCPNCGCKMEVEHE